MEQWGIQLIKLPNRNQCIYQSEENCLPNHLLLIMLMNLILLPPEVWSTDQRY